MLTLSHFESYSSYIPIDLLDLGNATIAFCVILGFILGRYFLMVGSAYFVFWKSKAFGVHLHDFKLPKNQIRKEIGWSMVSSFLFAISGLALGLLWQAGVTQIYLDLNEYGLLYLPLSFFLYSLVHEVYFYFTHVWMHRPWVYQRVHAVHHSSVKTSPFASFSFHPYEAFIHAVFLPIMVVIVPIHPLVLLSYLTFMTLTAISNHLGIELIPFKVVRQNFISGGHHFIHHRKMKYNFGLYYTFMDKVMGTEANLGSEK
ncbi:MAG: sterol desaturase [Halobacteriovoraceae bacterium]|nr:sterol desaturase [Halobacteriovoraceae bacterium]|tara:strand:- start:158575 stop:159348 length:774 start_codon:yes stop_codon:yes gene_type:complete